MSAKKILEAAFAGVDARRLAADAARIAKDKCPTCGWYLFKGKCGLTPRCPDYVRR